MAKSKSYLVEDHHNHIFDVSAATNTYAKDLNVVIHGVNGKYIHSIKADSLEHVEHIKKVLVALILSFQQGERLDPDWTLPETKPSTKKATD